MLFSLEISAHVFASSKNIVAVMESVNHNRCYSDTHGEIGGEPAPDNLDRLYQYRDTVEQF